MFLQERKKAVIEGTRQSVRRIARRFTTTSQEIDVEGEKDAEVDVNREEEAAINVFSSIQFQSPINRSEGQGIYNNVGGDSDVSVSKLVISKIKPTETNY